MPNVNTQFQGATLILPGAYYADNVSATQPTVPALVPPMVFIGFGYGGKPLKAYSNTTAVGLNTRLRGGPAAGFVPFIFNPSTEMAGATLVTYINPAANTRSTLTLQDSAASGVIALTSANYGTPSNLLQAEVTAGTIGGVDLTLYDAYANQQQIGDNLGLPFQLAYTGTDVGTTFSVTTSGGVATAFSVSGSTAAETVTFQLGTGTYSTVTALVEALNGTGFYSAQVISGTNGALPTSMLDAASSISLPAATSGGVYTYVNVTAALGDVVYWVNQFASALASAAIVTGIVSSPSTAPADIGFTYFTGATNSVPTLQDYADAFNLALTVPGWTVAVDTNEAGIAALGTQHAVTASSIVERKFRRFFTGSSVGDTIGVTTANARGMNAMEASYVYPGIYRTNLQTGQNELYGGLYAAASCAAMAAGNRVAEPLTNKNLVGNGVELALTTSQINVLQQAGVICLRVPDATGVPTIVSDLTTWQNDNNPENVFNQQVACRQFLAYSLIQVVTPYVGQIDAGVISLGKIKNAVKSLLNNSLYSGTGSAGILSSWNAKSLVLTYTGATQTVAITVDVVFVGQNRFITIFVPVQPLNAVA
jgi:hypothetical protein